MFTPNRKCRVDGLPKQRGSKVRSASLLIYLSAENASSVQAEAGHASLKKNRCPILTYETLPQPLKIDIKIKKIKKSDMVEGRE